MAEWIPTSERLPRLEKDVLCSFYAGGLDVACLTKDKYGHYFFQKHDWYVTDQEYELQDVKAWMPLPEPYKED